MDRYIFLLIIEIMSINTSIATRLITGRITNPEGMPVENATVLLPGGQEVVCNRDGEFSFCADSFSFPFTITVSSPDYNPEQVIIGKAERNLHILLTPKIYLLDEVTVMQKASLKTRSNAAVITVGKDEVDERMPLHVGELLGTRPGFTQRSGYQIPIILRGLSGKRLLVLRNGSRRFSSYPAGFMSHTVNVYDLERIEVEKGAASVRYGSGAIAGIINLIDRSPFSNDGLEGRVTAGYGSNNAERTFLSALGWGTDQFACQTNFRYRKAGNMHYPDGTVMENSFYEDQDVLLKTAWKPNNKNLLELSADLHWGGPWGKPKGFNGTGYMLATTNDETTRNLALNWSFIPGKFLQQSTFSVFYSHESREPEKRFFTAAGYRLSFREITRYTDYYYGAKWIVDLKFTGKLRFSTGAEYYSFHISSPTESIDYIQNLSFRNRVSINARSFVSGLFSEAVWQLSDQTRLTGGLRFDHDRVHEGEVFSLSQEKEGESTINAISASVAMQYRIAERSLLKVNVARSFRLPETTELFADNYTSRGILYGNAGLNPEYCYSVDASLSSDLKGILIEVSPFLWLMHDMISQEEVKGQPGTNFQYVNIGKTRLWGGELTMTIPVHELLFPDDRLAFTAGISYVNGTDVTRPDHYFSSGEPLDFIPPFNMKSELNYHAGTTRSCPFNLILGAIYYTRQNRLPAGGYTTPAYVVTDLSAGTSVSKWPGKPAVRLVINNLFDTVYKPFQSYLPAEGRNFRLFLTFNL